MAGKYRSKKEMVEDVVVVLNEKRLTRVAKCTFLEIICWKWTEFPGSSGTKCKVVKKWTKEAVELYNQNLKDPNIKDKFTGLRHEHIVPKKLIVNSLFQLKNPTYKNVRRFFDKYVIACIVTIEEHKLLEKDGKNNKYKDTMPSAFFGPKNNPDYRNVWLRYKLKPDIKVVDRPDYI